MVQDLPPAFGQGHPDGTPGRQPWYPAYGVPQQQSDGGVADPPPRAAESGYEQPWQQDVPAQRDPGSHGTGFPQPATGYDGGQYPGPGYAEPGYVPTGYPQQSGYPQQPGYPQAGYDQGSYDQAHHQQQQSPYGQVPYGGTPDQAPYGGYAPYADHREPQAEQLYAPPGAEYSQDGYLPTEPPQDRYPGSTEPVRAGESAGESTGNDEGNGVRQAAGGGARTDEAHDAGTAPAERGRPSLTAKARAAAGAVLSAEHAPGRRALALRAGAGLAALAVLVTAGVVVSGESSGSGTGSPAGSGEKNFTVAHAKVWTAAPAAAREAGTDDTLIGSWLLDDTVVRAESTGVHAYALADGRATWSVEPPAPGAVPCGLSPAVNDAGLGAVLFRTQAGPDSPCTLVAAVDSKTGKTAWTKILSDTKEQYTAQVGVTDDKVIAVGDDRTIAWQSADGADVWQYTGQGKYCTLSGGVQGKTVLLHSSCADSTPVDQAVSLNTADGKVGWWRGLNNQPRTVTVLSAEPAVVVTTGEKPADDRIFAWGPAGDPAAEIPIDVDDARIDAAHGSFSAVPGLFFQDHTMAVTLAPANGGPLGVAAYDLTTGKQLWKAATAEKGKIRAVGLDSGALLLAADERLGQPARLSRFALDGGRETVGGGFPQGTGSLLIAGRVLIGGGKVVAVPEHSATFGTAAAYQAKG